MTHSKTPHRKPLWGNWLWAAIYLVLLLAVSKGLSNGTLCQQMGVDFRGYYASGQIARQHGLDAVYDQELQKAFQADLLYHCPTPAEDGPLYVAMPYFPPFVFFFIPFTFIDFTASFIVWISLQLGGFILYLHRFSKALGIKTNGFRLIQWGFGLPLISNLYVGQINALLVVFLGEFLLSLVRGNKRSSGLWLSLLLIKPHTLVLLLPGLLLSQNWQVLFGFSLGAGIILGSSLLLTGLEGMTSIYTITTQFAGSLIQTAAGMMNFRALGLNLAKVFAPWIGWSHSRGWHDIDRLAGASPMAERPGGELHKTNFIALAATSLGTLIVTWHSHFYMQMLLIPMLYALDQMQILPQKTVALWLLGPSLIYIAAHLIIPEFERNIFGLSMLGLNIYTLVGILKQIKPCEETQ